MNKEFLYITVYKINEQEIKIFIYMTIFMKIIINLSFILFSYAYCLHNLEISVLLFQNIKTNAKNN
jgi:hypothetical protein